MQVAKFLDKTASKVKGQYYGDFDLFWLEPCSNTFTCFQNNTNLNPKRKKSTNS